MSLKQLSVEIYVLHASTMIFDLWAKDDSIYKTKGRYYYIQFLMKIVAIQYILPCMIFISIFGIWHFIHYTNIYIYSIINHVQILIKVFCFFSKFDSVKKIKSNNKINKQTNKTQKKPKTKQNRQKAKQTIKKTQTINKQSEIKTKQESKTKQTNKQA